MGSRGARGTYASDAQVNLVASGSFVLGGALFALGAACAGLGVGEPREVSTVYLVGGFFFSLGGYVSIKLANRRAPQPASTAQRAPRWSTQRRGRLWRSALVLFVGTLFFAVSLVAAFAEGLTPRQSNGWIWLPDILGCVCFLLSGHLAMLDVCGGRPRIRVQDVGWWVVAVNQLGSVLFFLAGIAAFTRPAVDQAINVGLVNWGTCAGALCFAIAGIVQAADTPTPTRTVVHLSHDTAN